MNGFPEEAVLRSVQNANRRTLTERKKPKYESQRRDYIRTKHNESRIKVLQFLGGECCKCGFDDFRALQIDHVLGDRKKDCITSGKTYHKRVMESFELGENRYQLLCANCNWIKKHERGEKPRRKDEE